MSDEREASESAPHVLLLRADWNEPTWRDQAARERLRSLSRRALRELAARSGAPSGPFEKDGDGAPLAIGDWRWSVSHAGGFAAAALGRVVRIGVDVEPQSRVPSENVCERLARLGVLANGSAQWLAAWCRVEAALKACGHGLSALGSVRVEGALVLVGTQGVMTRVFELGGAVLAVAGGGVCAMQAPRFDVSAGDAA